MKRTSSNGMHTIKKKLNYYILNKWSPVSGYEGSTTCFSVPIRQNPNPIWFLMYSFIGEMFFISDGFPIGKI